MGTGKECPSTTPQHSRYGCGVGAHNTCVRYPFSSFQLSGAVTNLFTSAPSTTRAALYSDLIHSFGCLCRVHVSASSSSSSWMRHPSFCGRARTRFVHPAPRPSGPGAAACQCLLLIRRTLCVACCACMSVPPPPKSSYFVSYHMFCLCMSGCAFSTTSSSLMQHPSMGGLRRRVHPTPPPSPGRPCKSVPPPPLGLDSRPGVCASALYQPGTATLTHTDPGASPAAEEGGSAPPSAGSGKLSRLRCVHPRRRTSASYARAASSLVAKYPTR